MAVISNRAIDLQGESGGDGTSAANAIGQAAEQRPAEHAGGADDNEVGAKLPMPSSLA